MRYATGRKIVLSPQQEEIAKAIFGEKLAADIISKAQKQIGFDDLIGALDTLKAVVDELAGRLTNLEMTKGYPLADKIFKRNGRPAGLIDKFYGEK